MMKKAAILAIWVLVGACVSTEPRERGPRQSQIRDCPPGMVLICESQKRPTVDAEGEVPVYDRCYCETGVIN
jgi:hypothetical protein